MYGSEEAGRGGGARDTRFLRDELDEMEHQVATLQRELKDKERQLLEERQISDRVGCWQNDVYIYLLQRKFPYVLLYQIY